MGFCILCSLAVARSRLLFGTALWCTLPRRRHARTGRLRRAAAPPTHPPPRRRRHALAAAGAACGGPGARAKVRRAQARARDAVRRARGAAEGGPSDAICAPRAAGGCVCTPRGGVRVEAWRARRPEARVYDSKQLARACPHVGSRRGAGARRGPPRHAQRTARPLRTAGATHAATRCPLRGGCATAARSAQGLVAARACCRYDVAVHMCRGVFAATCVAPARGG